jgi:eukaryotic-like serine/threonine-protein kinase
MREQPPEPNTTRPVLGGRYRLLDTLGSGGMGTVYRALDRLTGETVALKRVVASLGQAGDTPALRLALTREFQAMAALRHPNIVAVRDYGFDQHGQPYFTMDLLPQAHTILTVAQFRSPEEQLGLLAPVLHALAYLHRHRIVHRDLKPGNILVTGGVVKVLDFGLAATAGHTLPSAGTLIYAAPELLRGEPVTPAADLFSFGILAFELLAGWHPFGNHPQAAVPAILGLEPDWALLDLPLPIVAVLQRLLAKSPGERWGDATSALAALAGASGLPLPVETAATRESFLQAAPLTGREQEVAQLQGALAAALTGHPSGWLISGESGVGKSRLLAEVRTYGLVQGMALLQGQAVDEGGAPYHLWREPLQRLSLLAQPDGVEAGVLRPLLPQIGLLCEQPPVEAPPLEPAAAQTRLRTVIGQLLVRAAERQPLLLLLEDLHWADEESLALLEWLQRWLLAEQQAKLPLLILASYRQGEAPQLPARFGAFAHLPVPRLSPAQMGELSVAMVGSEGVQPQLVDFLQRETEGNAFFVVEVLRALVEEAGTLGQVGTMALPAQIVAGGIEAVLQRRLRRIPMRFQPILQWAAVAGRRLDLAVLRALAAGEAVEAWLTVAANALVLETQNGYWQFHHEKLRQAVLAGIDPAQRRHLHRQVGETIEQIYADHQSLYAADLAYHFRQAGDEERERHYSRVAGEWAAAGFANDAALSFFDRSLALTPPMAHAERFALLLAREQVHNLLGNRAAQWADLQALATVANAQDDPAQQFALRLRLANYAETTGDYPTALSIASAVCTLAADQGWAAQQAEGHLLWGRVYWRQGEFHAAVMQLEQALAQAQRAATPALEAECLRLLGTVLGDLGRHPEAQQALNTALTHFRTLQDRRGEGRVLNNLAVRAYYQSDYAGAEQLYGQAITIYRAIGDRHNESAVLNNLGLVADSLGEYATAVDYYRQALALYEQIDNRKHEGAVLSNLGSLADTLGDYETARGYFERSLAVRRALGDRQGEADTLISLALLYHHQEDHTGALALVEAGLALAESTGYPIDQGLGWTVQGHLLTALGRLDEATASYEQALAVRRAAGETNLQLEPLAGLARIEQARGNWAGAQAWVDDILAHLATGSFDGAYEPARIYLTCYEILAAQGDGRAQPLLAQAMAFLQRRAERIQDPEQRHTYLQAVTAHRTLLDYAGHLDQPSATLTTAVATRPKT